ncbi:MAG TPA: hypothetical protein VM050_06440 [Patescibacteria group bacterium]|nr:hypothetical protein [Patescibacteria group bacterium]
MIVAVAANSINFFDASEVRKIICKTRTSPVQMAHRPGELEGRLRGV